MYTWGVACRPASKLVKLKPEAWTFESTMLPMAEGPLTTLIKRAIAGDKHAYGEVIAATYDDLKRLAHARIMRSGKSANLNTTGLVHESYMRFIKTGKIDIVDRAHFFGYAGRVMRSVIVDAIRELKAQRRGGDLVRVTLSTGSGGKHDDGGSAEVLSVHTALDRLSELDEQLVQIVELRYFAGMTEAEIAEALEVSERTVRRRWVKAKLWLAETLADD